MKKIHKVLNNKNLKLFNSNGNMLYFVNRVNTFSKEFLNSDWERYVSYLEEDICYIADEILIEFIKKNNYKLEKILFDSSSYLYTVKCFLNDFNIISTEKQLLIEDVSREDSKSIYSRETIHEVINKIYKSGGEVFLNYNNFKKNTFLFKRKDLKLCFVEENFAYFTNDPNQHGSDWNDRPYEHNAERPYQTEGYELIKIGFVNHIYLEPSQYFNNLNSPFSVDMINAKFVPWLIPDEIKEDKPPIFADTSIKDFIEIIMSTGGEIYIDPKNIKKEEEI